MGKSPQKKKSKFQQSEMINAYTKLSDLSKDELLFIKQQLQNPQPVANPQKNRNKSNYKKTIQDQPSSSNKLYVITHSNSNDRMTFSSNQHNLESVNIYLQQAGLKKKSKAKKKKNMDLIDVCNDSTIIVQTKNDEENDLMIIENEEGNLFQEEIEPEKPKECFQESENKPQVSESPLQKDRSDKTNFYQSQNYNSDQSTKRYPNKQKQQVPNSMRKSNNQEQAIFTYMNNPYLKNSIKEQSNLQLFQMMDKNQRNASNQCKSVEGTSLIKQKENYNRKQSPREMVPKGLFQRAGINLSNNDMIQSLIDQKEKQLDKRQDSNSKKLKPGRTFSTNANIGINKQLNEVEIKESLSIQQQEEEQVDLNVSGENELNTTQFLLNYVPAQQTIVQTPDVVPSNQFNTNQEFESKEFQIQEEEFDCKMILDNPYEDQGKKLFQNIPLSTKNKETMIFQPAIPMNGLMTQAQFNPQNNLANQEKKLSQNIVQKKQPQPKPQRQIIDQIICQAISVESYFKRNMQKLGWVDQSSAASSFHIRFDITDKEGSQAKLKSSQWYSHFPNNRELTTKAGLCKNLWQQCLYDYELQVEKFFPRCYDLSDQKQVDQFVDDFKTTAILNIIKRYANHFYNTTQNFAKYLQEYKNKENYQVCKIYKQKLKLRFNNLDQQLSGAGSLLGNDYLRMAIYYAKYNIVKKINLEKKQYNRKFTEEDIQQMIDFSYQIQENGIPNQKFPLYEQIKIYILSEKIKQVNYQYGSIDGQNNVWVVKPSYNARGLGVYCSNKLKDIIQSGKKSQSKIVQKYIENPFLVNNKKFDIRQWVLVTSWEPLDVYVFSSSYLKICGNDYNLTNLADQYSHLSNFSIQKKNNQFTNDDLVMSCQQFQEYIQKTTKYTNFIWNNDMQPKIQDAVHRTFKGVQESMEQRPNTFEIYGFDLILDEHLTPWVIEVNLSPACNERTDWLTKMLDDMSMDVLNYLERKIITSNESEWQANFKDRIKQIQFNQNNINLNDEEFYVENNIEHRWVRIEDCITDVKNYQQSAQLMMNNQQKNVQQPFEILGTKIDSKFEKRIDKVHQKQKAIELIQRYYRGHQGRKVYKAMVQNKASILLQRYLRIRIAKNRVKTIINNKASTMIQKYLRKQIAIAITKRIIAEKISLAKQFVAIKIQSHFRRIQAFKKFMEIKKHKKAIIIQKFLRSYKSKQTVQRLMNYKCKVIKIQKFYKKRFRLLNNSSKLLQKYLKAIIARNRVIKLIKIKQASTILRKLIMMKKQLRVIQALKVNKVAVYLQSLVRRKQQIKRFKQLLKSKALDKLKLIFNLYILQLLKQQGQQYKTLVNSKVMVIQKAIKKYKAKKKVQKLREIKHKNNCAIMVQKYLRKYLAINIVNFRIIQLMAVIRLQAFARQIIARKHYRILLLKKQKQEEKKKRNIEKKFEKTKKVEKDIENYIESLFQREITTQNGKPTQKSSHNSHTPLAGKRNKEPDGGFTQMRQSFTSYGQFRDSQIEPNQPVFELPDIHSKYNEEIYQAFDNEAILAASMIDDRLDADSAANRQQKAVRVRKGQKGQSGQQLLTNITANKGSKVVYQKEFQNKMLPHFQKVKTTSNQGSQRQQFNNNAKQMKQSSNKPKTFAENLMNMLAMQNIGQVFSENPVEALTVFKNTEGIASNQDNIIKRRNSAMSRGVESQNQSFVNQSAIQQKANSGQSHISTIDSNTKSIQFPKLNEFKSATNNIYLVNRPVNDPRLEIEYQQKNIEAKLKQQNPSTYSRSDIKPIAPLQNPDTMFHRKSTESLRQLEKIPTKQDYEYQQDNILQRPNARDPNIMVLQLYKKQNQMNPFDHFKKTIKQKSESQKKSKHQQSKFSEGRIVQEQINANNENSVKKKKDAMPPINENGTKLIII